MLRRSLALALSASVSIAALARAEAENAPSVSSRPAPPSLQMQQNPAPGRTDTVATSTVVYHYDSLGRLILDQRPGTKLTYTYDGAGNRTQSTIQH